MIILLMAIISMGLSVFTVGWTIIINETWGVMLTCIASAIYMKIVCDAVESCASKQAEK